VQKEKRRWSALCVVVVSKEKAGDATFMKRGKHRGEKK
jgi:hypothetical protein